MPVVGFKSINAKWWILNIRTERIKCIFSCNRCPSITMLNANPSVAYDLTLMHKNYLQKTLRLLWLHTVLKAFQFPWCLGEPSCLPFPLYLMDLSSHSVFELSPLDPPVMFFHDSQVFSSSSGARAPVMSRKTTLVPQVYRRRWPHLGHVLVREQVQSSTALSLVSPGETCQLALSEPYDPLRPWHPVTVMVISHPAFFPPYYFPGGCNVPSSCHVQWRLFVDSWFLMVGFAHKSKMCFLLRMSFF